MALLDLQILREYYSWLFFNDLPFYDLATHNKGFIIL